jgi:hypothetical protein
MTVDKGYIELYAKCLSFVQEQSQGEWGEEVERGDALKLYNFVSKEIEDAKVIAS